MSLRSHQIEVVFTSLAGPVRVFIVDELNIASICLQPAGQF